MKKLIFLLLFALPLYAQTTDSKLVNVVWDSASVVSDAVSHTHRGYYPAGLFLDQSEADSISYEVSHDGGTTWYWVMDSDNGTKYYAVADSSVNMAIPFRPIYNYGWSDKVQFRFTLNIEPTANDTNKAVFRKY